MPAERLVRAYDLDAITWFLINGKEPAIGSIPEVPSAIVGRIGFPLDGSPNVSALSVLFGYRGRTVWLSPPWHSQPRTGYEIQRLPQRRIVETLTAHTIVAR